MVILKNVECNFNPSYIRELILIFLKSHRFHLCIGHIPKPTDLSYCIKLLKEIIDDTKLTKEIIDALKELGINKKKRDELIYGKISIEELIQEQPDLLFDLLYKIAEKFYNGSRNIGKIRTEKRFDL
jgi:hypothetical protein